MPRADTILINGLEFYAYHGASDQEQTVGHRYRVDARLMVDIAAASASDRLSDTVSYARVAKRLVEVGTGEQFRLLEALCAAHGGHRFRGVPSRAGADAASPETLPAHERDSGIGRRRNRTHPDTETGELDRINGICRIKTG